MRGRGRKILVTARLAAGLLALCLAAQAAGAEERLVVVANAANPYRPADRGDPELLRSLYLRTLTSWPDGLEAKPIAPAPGSEAHRQLVRKLLRMNDPQLARHWLSLKQRTGQTRPRSAPSDRLTLALIRRHPGAFGIVGREAAEHDPEVVILLEVR